MWRALFLALGFYACLLGAECLVIEKAELAGPQEKGGILTGGQMVGRARELRPPEWAPWSLMSVGAVTMLYSFTIPRRVKE
jgi:hypothetical protein